MTSRSIPAIDPGGVARRLGAAGDGIVFAVVGTGIDARHPHFARYANLELPPPLHHYDLTLVRERDELLAVDKDLSDKEAMIAVLSRLDDETLSDEALIDRQRFGTHVAAIVAGSVDGKGPSMAWDLLEPSMAGVAPKCKLLSLKVLDERGNGDELDVLRALEIVMALNARAGKFVVHGVLAPISINHDVVNYACGHTPLCDAVDRLVESGVVVVASSGNGGYVRFDTAAGGAQGAASLMTITDPGNAERAITVGATHRFRAQEYGASYFSSRGPTLDGRTKPDVLAPGERSFPPFPPRSRPRALARRRASASRSGGRPRSTRSRTARRRPPRMWRVRWRCSCRRGRS